MKTWIAVLLLAIAAQANAEKTLEIRNKAGGKIVLTGEPCPGSPALRRMMSTMPNSKTALGCWALINGEIHVRYDDGDLYTYPYEGFELIDSNPKGGV